MGNIYVIEVRGTEPSPGFGLTLASGEVTLLIGTTQTSALRNEKTRAASVASAVVVAFGRAGFNVSNVHIKTAGLLNCESDDSPKAHVCLALNGTSVESQSSGRNMDWAIAQACASALQRLPLEKKTPVG